MTNRIDGVVAIGLQLGNKAFGQGTGASGLSETAAGFDHAVAGLFDALALQLLSHHVGKRENVEAALAEVLDHGPLPRPVAPADTDNHNPPIRRAG